MKTFSLASLLLIVPACSDVSAPASPAPADGSSDTSATLDAASDAQPDGPRCEASSAQPAPRGDSAGVVDPTSGRLYVFGGDTGPVVRCIPAPAFNAETWRYDPTCDRWDAVMGDVHPSPRSRMAWALDTRRRRMVVFGGRFRQGTTGNYTLYNDVWAFDLATETWEAITPEGELPAARSNAAAVYDPESDALVLFGGNTSVSGLTFTPRNDTWALDLAQRTWRRVTTTGTAPTPRLFHSAALVGRAMLVYGGGGANAFMGPFYRDASRLDLATGAWSRVALTGDTDILAGRISAALVPAGEGALIVGGHDDGALGNRNDLLRLGADGAVSVQREGDALGTPGSGFCDFPPDFATIDDSSPERRSAFVLGLDPARNRAIVYGGKTDCGLAGDVWSLDLAAGTWRALRSTNDGMSCQRSGRENCRSLCN